MADVTAPAYVTLRKGTVARTVAVNDSINVDVDADDLILGVETLSGENWQDALVSLAMAGRLAIPRRKSSDG